MPKRSTKRNHSPSSSSDEQPSRKRKPRRRKTSWWDKSEADVYSRGNHIIFKGDVNKDNVYQLGEEIHKLNKEFRELEKNLESVEVKPKPIYLHINSYGGYLDDAWAAIDFIKNSKIPIHTVVEGRVASAASMMSVVGEKRYMSKYSRILIHQLSGGVWGKMAEIEDAWEDCKEATEDIIVLFINHTRMKRTEITKQLKHDRWWNLDQCKQKGLIDEQWKNIM